MKRIMMAALMMSIFLLPTLYVWIWVVIVAFGGTFSHYCMARALTYADATVVVPMDFLRVPLSATAGWLIYGERQAAHDFHHQADLAAWQAARTGDLGLLAYGLTGQGAAAQGGADQLAKRVDARRRGGRGIRVRSSVGESRSGERGDDRGGQNSGELASHRGKPLIGVSVGRRLDSPITAL